jgi:hypothetical protein
MQLGLASGDGKTRLRLKQLPSLIFRFPKMHRPKHPQRLLSGFLDGITL